MKEDTKKDYDWGILHEQEAIEAFQANADKEEWGVFEKLGKFSHFDFCSVSTNSPHRMTFIEVKSRRCKRDMYDDTIVPSVKIQKALELIGNRNKVYLIINFEDEICFTDIVKAEMRFGYNARTDRGKVELGHYAFIPLRQFTTIVKKEKK